MLQRLKVTSYALLILLLLVLPSQAVAQVLASPGIAHHQSATKLTASQKARLTIEEYIKETGASYCIAIAPQLNIRGRAEGTDWNYLRRCEQGLRNFQRGMVPNPSAPGGWVNCASSQRHGAFSSSCVGAWADLFVDPMGVAPVAPMGVAPVAPMGVAPVAPMGVAPVSPMGVAPVAPMGVAPVSPMGVAPVAPTGNCTTADMCAAAAVAQGLALGGAGYDFTGPFATKGCYSYESGKYQGMAYFGTGGSPAQMEAAPAAPKYRISCGGGGPAPIAKRVPLQAKPVPQ